MNRFRFLRWVWEHRHERIISGWTIIALFFGWILGWILLMVLDLSWFKPARYQIASSSPEIVIRLDTKTGELRAYSFGRSDPTAGGRVQLGLYEVARRP